MKLNSHWARLRSALAVVLALVLVMGCMALPVLADEEGIMPISEDGDDNVHVLEANTLTAFAQGDKADGDTEVVGDYFTVIYSAKTKIDSSSKEWEDGYKSDQRINFGGKATTEKNSVKFTTSGPATVKIWWAQGGDDNREYAILNSAGEVVVKTSGTYEKNKAYMSTLELAEAGTYFLGGETNNNYLFKVEVEEIPAATEKVSTLEANTLTAFAQGDKADGDTEVVGDYFTVIYSAKTKIDSSSKEWEDGYKSDQRINFGGKATTEKNSVKFTTSGPATVKIWWAQGGDDNREYAILNSAGEVVVKTSGTYEKNKAYMSTLELAEAGTYFLGGETNNNYLFKVEVTEIVGTKAPRADWEGVAAPEIKSVEAVLDEETGEPNGQVAVTVIGQVGYDAADQITVAMLDGEGWEVKALNSLAEQGEHTLKFSPDKSGKYTFAVRATREGEDAIHRGAETVEFDFTYPLGVPVMKYAVNDGKGGLTIEWNSVLEATGYIVTAGDKTVTTEGLNATRAAVEGLAIGDEVEVTVTAVRGDEEGKACDPMTVTVSEEAETAWVFATFGQSTSTKNNGYEVNEDGSVRVYSINGSGKVQPSAQDGLAFYYTAIDPSTTNFKLTATAHVNTWKYSNGQDGFGLIVMDKVGVNGSTSPVWCNSYMAGVTGFSDTYNGEKVQMRLGVGSLERSGVTEDWTAATAPAGYTGTWRTLDITGFGSDIRNLVGNCENADAVPGESLDLVDFTLTIEKDDAGYHVSYLDHNGVLRTNDYTDPGALSYVDPYVYVGMFAARNCDITFTDIELTTSAASGTSTGTPGTAVEENVEPAIKFMDASDSNVAGHKLYLDANVNGAVEIQRDGESIYTGTVTAGERLYVDVILEKGANSYTATLTPDKDQKVTSTEPVTTSAHTVTFAVDERYTIYIAPDGKDDAKGTKDDPTTLAAAVKCPVPGATIIITEGTYELSSGVTIKRGINGTEDRPISLIADPNAASRPVFDWGETGDGLTLSADYWYLYGFDTAFANGKGVHIGGNYNKLERVNAHDNKQSGISISRTWSSDVFADWPSNNYILNCSAWLNADSGYEDADGFEAKLTNGDGNVFDGCIAAYNADDGWDLFARGTANGTVTIKNSIAFKNGYDIVDGKEVNAGNGNGFKLGGNSYGVKHQIINSIAFANKGNGFTCNSNPDLTVTNCTGYGNGKGNLALYTESADSAYVVDGFVSFLGDGYDSIKAKGTQNKDDYYKDTNYFTGHISGDDVAAEWFVDLDTDTAILSGISRDAEGNISMDGYLELTDAAPADAGARLPGDQSHYFRDVAPNADYAKAVYDLCEKGYITGVTKSEYMPEKPMTRAEGSAVLHRVSGLMTPNLLLQYTDVKEGQWFTEAVRFVTAAGIAEGYDDKTFGPNDTLTLEQLAVMIYRYEQWANEGGFTGDWAFKLNVTDVADIHEWAYEAVAWCVMNKVIEADEDGILGPQTVVDRATMAKAIDAYINLAD